MKELIKQFGNDLEQAAQGAVEVSLKPSNGTPDNVVICGLGGSGISGAIASQLFADQISVPVSVVRDYSLPGFVSNKTLLIACSYSGNTEETLEAVEKAVELGCEIAVLTSGGQLLDQASSNQWSFIQIASGQPPRSAFAKAFPQVVRILMHYGLLNNVEMDAFAKAADIIREADEEIQADARKIAEAILDKDVIIYSGPKFYGVGERFRQQLNENSKVLCSHHFYPEMNHNELVGWAGSKPSHVVVRFSNTFEHNRNGIRWSICKEIMVKRGAQVFEIPGRGDTILSQALSCIYCGDWVSYFLSELRGVDCVEVNVIDHLKGELAKVQ